MKIAIVGSRQFNDFELMKSKMEAYQSKATQIISGGANGADELAAQWCQHFLHKNPIIFRPNWTNISHKNALIKYNKKGERYDARAGIRRNQLIVEQADFVVAFWDGQSKGTRHVIYYARQTGTPIEVIMYRENFQMELPF